MTAIPTGIRTWTDPDWRAEALAWAEVSLDALGRRVTGPIEQPHIMPWSTAFRIPTTGGVVWLKATGPGTAHEGPLLASLERHHVEHVLLPLASDHAHARLLFDDGGTTLRASGPGDTGDHDLAAWERVMAEYAGLQRTVERWSGELIAAGVPDERPDRLPAILDRLLDEDVIWTRVDEADVGGGPRGPRTPPGPASVDRGAGVGTRRVRDRRFRGAWRPARPERAGGAARGPDLRLGRRYGQPPVRDLASDAGFDRPAYRARPRRSGDRPGPRRLHGGLDRCPAAFRTRGRRGPRARSRAHR